MKKIIISLLSTAAILCSAWGVQAQAVYTPKKLYDFWAGRTASFDPESSIAIKGKGSSNTYAYDPATGRITLNADDIYTTGMYSNITFSVGRNNGTTYIWPRQDSSSFQATADQSFTVTIAAAGNPTAGGKKVQFEYSSSNNANGRIMEIVANGTTTYDTMMLGRGYHRVISVVLQNAGAQTVKFTNKKLEPWPSGGNVAWFRMEVKDNVSYEINTSCLPVAGGSVIKSPNKSDYDSGEDVTLTARPAEGYRFVSWSDGNTDISRVVTVENSVINLTANFALVDYTLTTGVNNSAWGTLNVVPVKAFYNIGDTIRLTAVPVSDQYELASWSDGNSSGASRMFIMRGRDTTITANFGLKTPYSITCNVIPAGAGSVQIVNRVPRSAGTDVFYNLDIADIVATANSGYEFAGWSDGVNDPERAVRVEGNNIVLTVNFRTETGNPVVPAPIVKPVIMVDFNVAGRQEKEVIEPRYFPWVVSSTELSKTFGDVNVSVAKVGNVGTGLKTHWYKAGVQAPYFARLVNDGITVDGGDAGGQIALTFNGLRKGNHTILLYLNTWDSPASLTFAPVDVYVNEVYQQTVMPTNRILDNALSAIAYVEFTARDLEDVVVRIAAVTTGTETQKNVCLAGFELNRPNPHKQARNPLPYDMNEHVDADNGTVRMSWQGALLGADSHDVYWGADSAAVAAADKTSPLFHGTKTALDTFMNVSGVYCMDTYYWRVDETKNDVTTRGNVWFFRPRVLAFRGAEGYGMYARGGRGGKVVYVTNLNNDGSGSLREATTNDVGPRYVVFAVGGRIHLNPGERITLNNNYVTVSGQTAPGKGICISGASYGISGAKDAIVRFMRVRVGQFGVTIDGMGMNDANYSIMDHNSISWTHDEAFSSRSGKNFTLQRTFISEALNVANHQNYSYGTGHGYAATIGGDTASFLCNLLAHNEGRNWSLGGGLDGDGYYSGHLDITNNVVYNYGGRVTDGGAHEVNFVNNYYKAGANSTSGMLKAQHEGVGQGTQKYYYAGNVLESYNSGNYGTFTCTGGTSAGSGTNGLLCGYSDQWSSGEAVQYTATVSQPFFTSHATILSAKNAFKSVVSDCGATMPVLDAHDLRVALETRDGKTKYRGSYTGKAGIPDHHMDVGGYENYPEITLNLDEFDTDRDGLPNWWEIEVSGTNPNGTIGDFSDTNADPGRDGQSHMEEYLEFMATPHFMTQKNRQVAVELSQYTRGYTKTPVYTAVSNGNGTVTIEGNWAHFLPNTGFKGVTYFEFKVTDGDGDTMTRRIGVRVTE